MSVQSRPPLTRGTKIFYGLGSIAFGVKGQALSSLLILFFNQVVGLPAAWVSGAIAVTIVLDAFIDPAIGQWSDNFRSRWGRRHPFMYASALPTAVVFVLLWTPPHGWSDPALFGYLIACLVSLRVLISFYEIPSAALAPELAPDYDQRTGLLSYRYFFGIAGGALMTVMAYSVFLRKDATHPLGLLNREGYSQYAMVAAVVMLASILIATAGTHGQIPYLAKPPPRRATLKAMAREVIETLSNRNFAVVLASGVVAAVAGGLGSGLGLYISAYYWEIPSQQVGLLVVSAMVSTVFAVSLASPISRRLGKKRAVLTLFWTSLLISSAPLALGLLGVMPPNGSALLLGILIVDGFVAGLLGTMGFIIVSSMVADIVEEAQVKTGRRSEGLLLSADNIIQSSVASIGVFMSGLLLTWVNFPERAQPGTVDRDILTMLVMIYLPVNLVFRALSIVCLNFYTIDRAKHAEHLASIQDAAALAGESEPTSPQEQHAAGVVRPV
jgi:Na+/melibiose symporter-like transporter